jgi:outer membrane protein TolC
LKRAQVQVAADTRHDFYQLIAERQAVAELETIVHRLRGVVRALRELPGGSEEHRIAINQARIAQSRAQAKLAGARRRQESARLALLDILAVSPPQPSQIQGSIPNRPLAIPGRETLLARSVHRRQDLQAAEQSVDAVHQQRRLVGRKVIPDPTVSMQYRTEEGDRIGGLGVSVGLPSFAAIRGSRRQANARLEQAQRRQDTLRRQVRRQVLQGIADYRAARRQLAALSPRVQERARINLRLVEEAARQGQLQPGRIGSVLESLLSLRTARQQALQDLIRAAVDLEKASGGLVVMGRYRAPGQKEPAAETTPAQARSPGP